MWVDYDYRDGFAAVHAATLSGDRTSIVSDAVAYTVPGPSPLSIERGPDRTLITATLPVSTSWSSR